MTFFLAQIYTVYTCIFSVYIYIINLYAYIYIYHISLKRVGNWSATLSQEACFQKLHPLPLVAQSSIKIPVGHVESRGLCCRVFFNALILVRSCNPPCAARTLGTWYGSPNMGVQHMISTFNTCYHNVFLWLIGQGTLLGCWTEGQCIFLAGCEVYPSLWH